jgi:predicted aspartyl protease
MSCVERIAVPSGLFRASDEPRFAVYLIRPAGPHRLDCLIDTGYSGFVVIPENVASDVGLRATGTSHISFANGAREPRGWCRNEVAVDGAIKRGVIVIDPQGADCIMGRQLLTVFQLSLTFDPSANYIDVSRSARQA